MVNKNEDLKARFGQRKHPVRFLAAVFNYVVCPSQKQQQITQLVPSNTILCKWGRAQKHISLVGLCEIINFRKLIIIMATDYETEISNNIQKPLSPAVVKV